MQDQIRNFCIIAHIDHGKSTLADRFLELTGTVEKRKMREQFLDQMDLEREKGITIKMQPVRMIYHPEIRNPTLRLRSGRESEIPNNNKIQNSNSFEFRASNFEFTNSEYILNLIDTPGHADFSYEVSRSLAAVEGAILLVDATKGVQAQTLAHLNHAKEQGLAIIPVVNKIDSLLAKPEEVAKEMIKLLGPDALEPLFISAKEGTNVQELLESVIERVPCPKGNSEKPFRALIFDSRFDAFKGIIAFVAVVDGKIMPAEKIFLLGTGVEAVVKEVGYFLPQENPVQTLRAGEIGYIATGVKEPEKVRIGDTIVSKYKIQDTKYEIQALPGFQIPKPVVFASFYPQNPNDFEVLKDALSKLRLSDPSLSYEMEAKEALGRGFRCGFLGVLHSEICSERVEREFKIPIVISRPSVEYAILLKDNRKISVKAPVDWPLSQAIQEMYEPWAMLEVITPAEFLAQTLQFLQTLEGKQLGIEDLGGNKFLARHEMPLREIITGLYERLKSVTQGMASMDYQLLEMRKADLVKLEFLIAGQKEEALSNVVPRQKAYQEGKAIIEKLKEVLPSQQFEVALQAVTEGRVIARETISARRRDVTAPLYGGDVTRKKKLLERQKKGKEELKARGRVTIPSKVFLDIFRA